MNQNLWWPETISWSWIVSGMTLSLTSSRTTHLTCYWTLTPPVKVPFYRIQRGVRTFCGYTWTLINCVSFDQNEAGLQLTKTFTLTPWSICNRAWWYFKGDTLLGPSASTSIIYTAHFPGVPGPAFPASPELITNEFSPIRAGNHYSWWSGSAWYVILAFYTHVRCYKRIAGVWTRLDWTHEPFTPGGHYQDFDTRLDSASAIIHIALAWGAFAYPPDRAYYATFDTTTDTWNPIELIHQWAGPFEGNNFISLSLDLADLPHVTFTQRFNLDIPLLYSNRTAGAWSPPVPFMQLPVTFWSATSACHTPDDTFHGLAIAFTATDLVYNSRPAAGPVNAQQFIDLSIANVVPPSISARFPSIHAAYLDWDFTLDHALGPAPWVIDPNIYPPPTHQPNIITPIAAPENRWLLASTLPLPIAVMRWQGGIWTPYAIPDISWYYRLAATPAMTHGISYVGAIQAPLPGLVRFFAFPYP